MMSGYYEINSQYNVSSMNYNAFYQLIHVPGTFFFFFFGAWLQIGSISSSKSRRQSNKYHLKKGSLFKQNLSHFYFTKLNTFLLHLHNILQMSI